MLSLRLASSYYCNSFYCPWHALEGQVEGQRLRAPSSLTPLSAQAGGIKCASLDDETQYDPHGIMRFHHINKFKEVMKHSTRFYNINCRDTRMRSCDREFAAGRVGGRARRVDVPKLIANHLQSFHPPPTPDRPRWQQILSLCISRKPSHRRV